MQEMDLSEGEWNQFCVYLQELATAMTELTKEGPQRNPARANTTRQWGRCQQCIGKQTSNHHREEGRWNNAIVATIIGGTAIGRTPETDLGSEDTRTTTQKAIGSVDDSSR